MSQGVVKEVAGKRQAPSLTPKNETQQLSGALTPYSGASPVCDGEIMSVG